MSRLPFWGQTTRTLKYLWKGDDYASISSPSDLQFIVSGGTVKPSIWSKLFGHAARKSPRLPYSGPASSIRCKLLFRGMNKVCAFGSL